MSRKAGNGAFLCILVSSPPPPHVACPLFADSLGVVSCCRQGFSPSVLKLQELQASLEQQSATYTANSFICCSLVLGPILALCLRSLPCSTSRLSVQQESKDTSSTMTPPLVLLQHASAPPCVLPPPHSPTHPTHTHISAVPCRSCGPSL